MSVELTNTQLKEIHNLLIDLCDSLQRDIDEAKKSSKPVKLDQNAVGRVSRIDAIQQQQMQLAAVQRLEQRLQMVKSALSRIDSEGFGICVKCEEEIGIERLLVRPEALQCIGCAGNKEKI